MSKATAKNMVILTDADMKAALAANSSQLVECKKPSPTLQNIKSAFAAMSDDPQSEGHKVQFGRVGHVEIDINNGKGFKAYKGLNFKFKVTKVLDPYPGDTEVSILGLSLETMNQIVSMGSREETMKRGMRVKVYAGYQDENNPDYDGDLLFEGPISFAKIDTPPPNMWLSILAIPAWDMNTGKFSCTTGKEKMAFKELCKYAVEKLNATEYVKGKGMSWDLDWKVKNEEILNHKVSFDFEGTLYQLIPKLCELSGKSGKVGNRVRAEIDITRDGKSYILRFWEMGVRYTEKDQKARDWLISKETGMIGLPTVVEASSLNCRCLLNPSLHNGDFLTVKSSIITVGGNHGVNGDKWQVVRITHTGEFRGTDWSTQIIALDPSRLQNTNSESEVKKPEKEDIDAIKKTVKDEMPDRSKDPSWISVIREMISDYYL